MICNDVSKIRHQSLLRNLSVALNNQMFYLQDEIIGQEMEAANQSGGCTALVALYLQGKLYVANAGDSRLVRGPLF